jgi:hypothetical protein
MTTAQQRSEAPQISSPPPNSAVEKKIVRVNVAVNDPFRVDEIDRPLQLVATIQPQI